MYVCLYVYVPACLYVFNMCAGACGEQKRPSHPLELKLQAVSCELPDLCTGNETWIYLQK